LEAAVVKNQSQQEVVCHRSESEVILQGEGDSERHYVCFCGLKMRLIDMRSPGQGSISSKMIACDAIDEWMSDRISWDMETEGEGKLALRMLRYKDELN
jgi:hypothetical protein